MTRFTSATDADRREMLAKIGMSSLEDLFADVPENLRLERPLDLPGGMSEQDVFEHLSTLAARNRHADEEVTFLGAGMYDHYVPALIDSIVQRSEFLTPYTVETIAESIYHGLEPALMPAARENVRAHLEKLRSDGVASMEADRWRL